MTEQTDFVPVADEDYIPAGYSAGFQVEDQYIAVFNVEGQLYAIEDRCPHMGVRMAGSEILEGGRVRCMLHGWTVKLGECQARDGMKRYPLRIADGKLQLSPTPLPRDQKAEA